MKCDQGHEWDENGVCKVSKKTFVVEIEEVITSTFFLDAENYERAMEMVHEGEYDPNDKETYFRENDRTLRDVVSIKEHEDE